MAGCTQLWREVADRGPWRATAATSELLTMRARSVLLPLLLMLAGFRGLWGLVQGEEDEEDSSRDRLAELLSLSELPLERLLQVRQSFARDKDNEVLPADEMDAAPDGPRGGTRSPAALPLVNRRVNPLLPAGRHKTTPTPTVPPLRRGMMWEEEEEEHPWMSGGGGGGKGKGKGISKIFQMSITTLAFLAFGGYLLCLIIQAVRGGNMMTMNMAGVGGGNAMISNSQPFIRPSGRRRRAARDAAHNGANSSDQVDGMYRALTMIAEGYALYHTHI